MRNQLILTLGFTAALLISPDAANAQSRTRTAATQTQLPPYKLQPVTLVPQTHMPPVQKCLKALDGSGCVKTEIAEATRQRAAILSSVRVSYYGTPQGSIGGPYIPFERLFQDNDVLSGLPTFTCAACATFRSK
jgi:hypothetical protein